MNFDLTNVAPLPLVVLAGIFILNLIFSLGVRDDANKLRGEGSETQIVCPTVWVIATIVGGVYVAAVYWVIHRSTLSRAELPRKEADPLG